MENQLKDNEKNLITELLMYAKNLNDKNLEHLVWIGEGMHYATKKEKSEENTNK